MFGNPGDQFLEFLKSDVLPFLPDMGLQLLKSLGLFCRISGVQTGHFNSQVLLQTHAVVICTECNSVLSCCNIQSLSFKRNFNLDGSRCCSKTCLYYSAQTDPAKMC
ncbi:Hypothetical predicted protein [Xyrichtys novacula]|uniref:Uncharacterized protein n=1 Tax=Xyrichtys novacula TaxID=13765 RepID=A0AAV1FZ29_XYRNO|nr:Hypothetical predicted protein [Xyrichtys novacula]